MRAYLVGCPVIYGLVSFLIVSSAWAYDHFALSSSQVSSSDLGFGHAGSSGKKIIGCWPCSEAYLAGSYFDHHSSLLDSDFYGFLAQEFASIDSCKELVNDIHVLRLTVHRHLKGEGSHRHLVSTLGLENSSDAIRWLDSRVCEFVIIERLPDGAFADPFELQHLVHRRVFLDAAVFGDTNVELPSALSNRSIVEIHMDIGYGISLKGSEIVVELPLHARYPPLSASGYATVQMGRPDLFIRCRPKKLQTEFCMQALGSLGGSANSVVWRIPCGNEAHTGIVSSITFVAALLCALLIVYSAVYFPQNNDIKDS